VSHSNRRRPIDYPDQFDVNYLDHSQALATILLDIAKRQGWSQEDIATLARVTADDYYSLFKATKGDEVQALINAFAMLATGSDHLCPLSAETERNALAVSPSYADHVA
jgi:hypothetical protein